VAVATLKLDGLFFLLGCLVGVIVFGEAVPLFRSAWEHVGDEGRLTLFDWLGISATTLVFFVMAMALVMFAGAEKVERIFTKKRTEADS
jgi:hypothetical protein